jgi:hypothetical protein
MTSEAILRSRCSLLALVFLSFLLTGRLGAHPVEQLFAELDVAGGAWAVEVLFDAAYALPEFRADDDEPPPVRAWLVGLPEEEMERVRVGAESFLREEVQFFSGGDAVDWRIWFPDFDDSPPSFPVLLNGGAYLRVELSGRLPRRSGAFEVALKGEGGPNLVVAVGAEGEPDYVTVSPEGRAVLFEFEGRGNRGAAASKLVALVLLVAVVVLWLVRRTRGAT